MSKKDKEENEKKYENLNNNDLKFKDKNPSDYRSKELNENRNPSSSLYSNHKKGKNSDSRSHKREDSRSISYSNRSKHSNKYKKKYSSYREDRKYKYEKRRRSSPSKSGHSNDDSSRHRRRKSRSRNRSKSRSRSRSRSSNRGFDGRRSSRNRRHYKHYGSDTRKNSRKHLKNNNSINALIQGKSSNFFYDDNYLPLSSNNSYNYLGNNLGESLENNNNNNNPLLDSSKNGEIPISTSDLSKKDLELYVINLSNDLSEEQAKELLNTALISIEANDTSGGPIVKVTKNNEKKYYILEFRTTNECNNAMKLNGMQILYRTLKIGKPTYINGNENNNNNSNNSNNAVHDLFPMLSSFEKELNYKTAIENKINNSLFKNANVKDNYTLSNNMVSLPIQLQAFNNNLSAYRGIYNNQMLNDNNNLSSAYNNRSLQAEPGTKLHIINLPLSFDENSIIKFFKTFGEIRKIELLHDETTKKFNGECYLEYENEKSYQDAINYGTGVKLGNNILVIKRINPKDNSQNIINKNSYLKPDNYKGNSTLGILASSINLGSIAKK